MDYPRLTYVAAADPDDYILLPLGQAGKVDTSSPRFSKGDMDGERVIVDRGARATPGSTEK